MRTSRIRQLPEDTWTRLAQHEGEPCVTAVLPISRQDLARNAMGVRVRGLVDRASAKLKEAGVERAERRQLLEPLQHKDVSSEGIPSDGATLVAALSATVQELILLDGTLEERVEVADRFVLSEFLANQEMPRSWYVLAISDSEARLIHVKDGAAEQVELPLERENRAAANAERVQPVPSGSQHANRHSATSTGGAPDANPQSFGSEDTDRLERKNWYGFIVKALPKDQIGTNPVVLVADTVHHGQFLDLCDLKNLLPKGVQYEPQGQSDGELVAKAQSLVQPLVKPDLETLRNRWFEAEKEGRSTDDPDTALEAAKNKQVELVMWVPASTRDAEELSHVLDDVVRHTVLNGGKAVPLEPGELPRGDDEGVPLRLNVILRWSDEG